MQTAKTPRLMPPQLSHTKIKARRLMPPLGNRQDAENAKGTKVFVGVLPLRAGARERAGW